GGKLKILAVMSDERHEDFPDVPTAEEEGLDMPEITAWGGFGVAKNTPDDIKEKMVDAVEKAIKSDEFKEMAEKRGMVVSYQDPDEFKEFAKEQHDFYKQLLSEMDLDD